MAYVIQISLTLTTARKQAVRPELATQRRVSVDSLREEFTASSRQCDSFTIGDLWCSLYASSMLKILHVSSSTNSAVIGMRKCLLTASNASEVISLSAIAWTYRSNHTFALLTNVAAKGIIELITIETR